MHGNYNSVTIRGGGTPRITAKGGKAGYSPHHRERRQGAGLSFLPPNRLPKGGLRRSDFGQKLSDNGGDPRG